MLLLSSLCQARVLLQQTCECSCQRNIEDSSCLGILQWQGKVKRLFACPQVNNDIQVALDVLSSPMANQALQQHLETVKQGSKKRAAPPLVLPCFAVTWGVT